MKTTFLCVSKKNLILAFLFFLTAFINAEDLHIVKNGDTIYSISKKYGVGVDDVLFLNGIEDARKIFAGQKLRIPSGSIRVSSPEGQEKKVEYISYTVKNGDTLYGIAREYKTTYQELLSKNKLPSNYVLKIGDKLKVPVNKAAAPAAPPALKTAELPKTAVAGTSPKKEPALKNSLKWPVRAKETSYMEGRLGGMLITGEQKEPVLSLTSGTVVTAGPYRGFGRVVIIKTDAGYKYIYGGCESLAVKIGDRISPGTEVGKLGVDTRSSKPQLTLIVYHDNKPVDPAKAPRS